MLKVSPQWSELMISGQNNVMHECVALAAHAQPRQLSAIYSLWTLNTRLKKYQSI